MNIGTITVEWFDFMLGTFFFCVWLAYDGSLVEDVAAWFKRKLKEKNNG
jgi:heme exporter protein D